MHSTLLSPQRWSIDDHGCMQQLSCKKAGRQSKSKASAQGHRSPFARFSAKDIICRIAELRNGKPETCCFKVLQGKARIKMKPQSSLMLSIQGMPSAQLLPSSPSLALVRNVVIVGGGNGAHVLAALSSAHFSVSVLTRQPQAWKAELSLLLGDDKTEIQGSIATVTDDPRRVIPQADLIIFCSPVNVYPIFLRQIVPLLSVQPSKTTFLGALFGQGGLHWMIRSAVESHHGIPLSATGIVAFGAQTIPWLCRIMAHGEKARIIGHKKYVELAVEWPGALSADPARLRSMQAAFLATYAAMVSPPKSLPIKVKYLPNFLSLTLVPSNQIIHTGRYYSIFKDWDGKTPFDSSAIPLLYEDMDDRSIAYMQALDDELQAIKSGLLKFAKSKGLALNLDAVKPLKQRICDHYGSGVRDQSSLRQVFRTNLSYRFITTPVTLVAKPGPEAAVGGSRAEQKMAIPDLKSRLFWDDIPYGLCILKNIAELLGLATPTMDTILTWHQQWMNRCYLLPDGRLAGADVLSSGAPKAYGIDSLEKLLA